MAGAFACFAKKQTDKKVPASRENGMPAMKELKKVLKERDSFM